MFTSNRSCSLIDNMVTTGTNYNLPTFTMKPQSSCFFFSERITAGCCPTRKSELLPPPWISDRLETFLSVLWWELADSVQVLQLQSGTIFISVHTGNKIQSETRTTVLSQTW